MELIKTFAELGKNDAGIAGGKGASLGEMTRAGIPVPPGFVVLAGAFEQFLAETDLAQEIDAVLHTVKTEEMHTVEHASEKIQALILNAVMPADIGGKIAKHFKELDAEFVAVRSSATAEDSASAAWAGQLDSFLNTDEASLLKNVQRCWASLFTPRAIFYRFEKGLHTTKISVAVVVQKMVQSEVSGIAFSVHPVTEDRNQLIIEAGWGLGEAIVSGQITPDSYVVEKSPRRIIDTNVNTQTRALYRAGGGGNEWKDVPEPKASSQVLSNEQVLELAELVIKIESHYNFPCDIEWAFASGPELVEGKSGNFYIVQSRPITTLSGEIPKTTSPFDSYQFMGLWRSDLFAAYFWTHWYKKEVIDSMGFSLGFSGCMSLKGGYFLYHKEALRWGREEVDHMVADSTRARSRLYREKAAQNFRRLIDKTETFVNQEPTAKNFIEAMSFGEELMAWWVTANLMSPVLDEQIAQNALAAHIPAEDVIGLIPAFESLFEAQQTDAARLRALLGDRSVTTQTVSKDPELKKEFEAHLQQFGWLELINYIGTPLSLERLLEQLNHLSQKEHKKTTHNLSQNFRHILEIATDIGYVRQGAAEYSSIFHFKLITFLEKTTQKIGLTYREMLNLVPQEIADGLSGAKSRKELYALVEKRKNYNWLVYSEEETERLVVIDDPAQIEELYRRVVPTVDPNTTMLTGQVGNKGKATGRATVIMATDDFPKFIEGGVLITTMTTPDFVILMQKSKAIVTDIGGMLSHASIVSRELNKPCVIGTKFATQVFKDGDLVEVDAEMGIVRKI